MSNASPSAASFTWKSVRSSDASPRKAADASTLRAVLDDATFHPVRAKLAELRSGPFASYRWPTGSAAVGATDAAAAAAAAAGAAEEEGFELVDMEP